MDKDQDLFIKHCRTVFGGNYGNLRIEARRRHDQAVNKEPVSYKKKGAGIKAGNLFLLGELKKVGEENWRPQKGEVNGVKKSTARATGASVSSGVKQMQPLPKGMKGIQL